MLFFVYDKWLKASGFRMWIWQKPGWRFYLWLSVGVICLLAAGIEGHGIAAIENLLLEHVGGYALTFFSCFIKDILIAVCIVSAAAIALGVNSPRQSRPDTPP